MISAIVAIEKNHGIGFQGRMPWPHLSDDMRWFKKLTTNQIVIMGSTTYKSIGKSLPNRINVVLSKKQILGDHTFSNINDSLNFCNLEYPDKEIFIIGGSEIYNSFKHLIQTFYITEIDESFLCDRFFDFNYIKTHFTKVKEIAMFTDPINYTIRKYNI